MNKLNHAAAAEPLGASPSKLPWSIRRLRASWNVLAMCAPSQLLACCSCLYGLPSTASRMSLLLRRLVVVHNRLTRIADIVCSPNLDCFTDHHPTDICCLSQIHLALTADPHEMRVSWKTDAPECAVLTRLPSGSAAGVAQHSLSFPWLTALLSCSCQMSVSWGQAGTGTRNLRAASLVSSYRVSLCDANIVSPCMGDISPPN